MKNKFRILSILLVFLSLLSYAQPGMSQEKNIRLLTYNIYHGQNPVSAEANVDSIAALILKVKPDVVALQEVDSMTNRSDGIYGQRVNLMELLAKKTGMTAYFAKAMDFSTGGYGEGLLVNSQSSFTTQLLPIPVGGEPRSAAWADISIANKIIRIGGTHLCHQFPENRKAQVQAILDDAAQQSNPTIWMGDLNFTPEDEEYKLIPADWIDAAQIKNDDSPTYRSENSEGRIDYIWYSARHFELVKYKVLEVDFSDHFPVLVELKIK